MTYEEDYNRLARAFKHAFSPSKEDSDLCYICRLDLREEVHYRANEQDSNTYYRWVETKNRK